MIEHRDRRGEGEYMATNIGGVYRAPELWNRPGNWKVVGVIGPDTLAIGPCENDMLPRWRINDPKDKSFVLLHGAEINQEAYLNGWIRWVRNKVQAGYDEV